MNAKQGRLARQQARRRQRERLAGAVVVVLGLVVLIVALIALQHPKNRVSNAPTAATASSTGASSSTQPSSRSSSASSRGPSPGPSPGTSARTSSSRAGAKSVPIIVLNNTAISGLAKDAAARFRVGGWTVTRFDNFRNVILSTCAYYDPADPNAKIAAEALRAQYPTIKRVRPKFAELPSGPVVVVLTPDYAPA